MNIDIENIRTHMVDMPTHIKAYTVLMHDVYTIVLNSKLSAEENRESYQHELDHILRGDYDKRSSVDLIEFFSHQ